MTDREIREAQELGLVYVPADQPHPMTIKSIEIIRKWNTGILPEEPKKRRWRKP